MSGKAPRLWLSWIGVMQPFSSVAYDPAFTVQSVIAPPDFNVLDGIWSKALTAMVSINGDISGDIAELQKNLEAMIAQRPASWAQL